MMFNLQRTMNLLLLVFPLIWFEATFGVRSEPNVIIVEGSDVILPCSLSSKENIEFTLFEWKKDGQKEVFGYDSGTHTNNGRPGQDEQFKERVSHFEDGLKSGNASIIIRNTKLADSGDYTCDFPQLQPRQIFHIELVVVGGDLKDRTAENIPGAATKPYVRILKQTENQALLQCEVRGASPKPKLHWQDSDGNILQAEEPKVTERGGRYDVILQTTVTKTDDYRCVATQEEISHQIYAEIHVNISEPNVIIVKGSDVILPCSLSSKESIEFTLFDWKKDGQKEVFVYDSDTHTNIGRPGQDEQFKGRVSHFPDGLKSGKASIKIRNTTLADSGDYTCDFPQLQPRQTFHIKLFVIEPNVIKVEEGRDVILPCSLSSKESLEFTLFEWKKDGQKEVFGYNAGIHSNNGFEGQDEQFKGRVSHFKDGLMSGNASIIIRNTKMNDSGDYTCEFPQLQPRQIFHIKLCVGAENIKGQEPNVKILNQTKDWALLQCKVQGASPKPKLQWQDSDGNILHAEEPKVTERGGSYDVILQTTVTKTDYYRCVATQEEICGQIYSETHVYIHGDGKPENNSGSTTGWIILLVLLVVVIIVLVVLIWKGYITINGKKGSCSRWIVAAIFIGLLVPVVGVVVVLVVLIWMGSITLNGTKDSPPQPSEVPLNGLHHPEENPSDVRL